MSENNEAAEHTSLLSKLKAENKALKEATLTCADCGRTFDYIQKLEASRDDLLVEIGSIEYRLGQARQKAEALKEETK